MFLVTTPKPDAVKREVSHAERMRLAREGKALPDGSYPIANAEDLQNAAAHVRMGHGDVSAARRLIARRAAELGVRDPLKPAKAEKAVMRDWVHTYQPQPVPGDAADSPGNHPAARLRSRLAAGHQVSRTTPDGDRFDPARVDVHDWNQVTRPAAFATVATVSGECTALASSIAMHQGKAVLGLMDMSQAANPSLTSQLRAAPSGSPEHAAGPACNAPSGYGETFGRTPARPAGPAYLPGVR